MADSDITVAVATHKAYRMPIDGVYMPLQVGRALHPNVDLGMTCDNTGDNISQLNAQYSELTGLYWMWKNCDADYQGLVHYRRHFAKMTVRNVMETKTNASAASQENKTMRVCSIRAKSLCRNDATTISKPYIRITSTPCRKASSTRHEALSRKPIPTISTHSTRK